MNSTTKLLVVILFSILPITPAIAVTSYRLTDLGNLGGQSVAHGLNDNGQVVGEAMLPSGDITAFLWQQSTGMVNLGALPGDNLSYALSINDAGQIVGGSQGPSLVERGVLWQPVSGMVDIDSGTNLSVSPFAINQQGQIYGATGNGGFVYTTTTGLEQVNVPGATVDAVFALNGRGQMVIPDHANNDIGLLFYSPGEGLVPIQTSTGLLSSAVFGMNEQGTVIGEYVSPSTMNLHGFVWSESTGMVDLTPSPDDSSWIRGVNDLGQAVGDVDLSNGEGFPVLYENGTLYNLTSFLDDTATGWTDMALSAINDNGDIAGYGLYNGQQEAFLLTPDGTISVPEPAAIPLAAGFCIFTARRRLKASA